MTQKNRPRKSAQSDDRGKGLVILVGIVVYVIVHFIWWILAALVLVVTGLIVRAIVREQLRRKKSYDAYVAGMVGRADEQSDLFLRGDDRGIYGTQGARWMSAIWKGHKQPR